MLESSYRDDSNKWSNIELGQEITKVELIEVILMHLIWGSDCYKLLYVRYSLVSIVVLNNFQFSFHFIAQQDQIIQGLYEVSFSAMCVSTVIKP